MTSSTKDPVGADAASSTGAKTPTDSSIDFSAFNALACGLDIVSAKDASGRKCGCVINTFLQVSNKPAKTVIAINKDNVTTRAIQESGQFAVSILGQSAAMELIGLFGFQQSDKVDKFKDTPYAIASNGAPYVTQSAVAFFALSVYETVDVGTHLVFFANVQEAHVLSDETPMTYAYYHNHLRGKTPPKAATFNPEKPDATAATGASKASGDDDAPLVAVMAEHSPAAVPPEGGFSEPPEETSSLEPRVGWQCTLCGYIVEGYPDGLPDGWTCPLCGMGREFFERVTLA